MEKFEFFSANKYLNVPSIPLTEDLSERLAKLEGQKLQISDVVSLIQEWLSPVRDRYKKITIKNNQQYNSICLELRWKDADYPFVFFRAICYRMPVCPPEQTQK